MNKLTTFLESNDEWSISNAFFLMNDVERMRKFLARMEYFKMVLDVPGDIVELGVMKGIGMAQFLKLREIFIPGSNKKVIGFDLFSKANFEVNNSDSQNLTSHYQECEIEKEKGIKKEELSKLFDNIKLTNNRMGMNTDIYQLVEGDVKETIPKYLEDNIGFRISFLYCDMDVEDATYFALEKLFDRVVKGGIIVFDEYACEKWGESNAVDKFMKNHPELEIKTTPWVRTPSAYIIKK